MIEQADESNPLGRQITLTGAPLLNRNDEIILFNKEIAGDVAEFTLSHPRHRSEQSFRSLALVCIHCDAVMCMRQAVAVRPCRILTTIQRSTTRPSAEAATDRWCTRQRPCILWPCRASRTCWTARLHQVGPRVAVFCGRARMIYRWSSIALIGHWRASADEALQDALQAGQAFFDSNQNGRVVLHPFAALEARRRSDPEQGL